MATFDIKNFSSRLPVVNSFDGNLVHGAKKFHSTTNRTGKGRPSDGGLTREHAKVVADTGKDRYQRLDGAWEDVDNCPVCLSKERDFFLTRLGIDVYKCTDCTHRYISPRVKFDVIANIYSDDKTASDIYTSSIQINIDRVKYQYGLDLIEQLSPPGKKKIMDVGCGAGVFLNLAFENGWEQCVGVDINDRYSDGYQNIKGVQFISAPFESLTRDKVGEGYDVISLWGCLEHLYDLDLVLKRQRELLKPGGLIFVLVPNVESLATRLMREMSPTFMWKHVCHFSPKSLLHLMTRHDFKCEHLESVITEIDNVKSYMSGEYPYHGYGDPEGLFEFITPEYIHKNMLGSRLIGIFRR